MGDLTRRDFWIMRIQKHIYITLNKFCVTIVELKNYVELASSIMKLHSALITQNSSPNITLVEKISNATSEFGFRSNV